MGWGLRGGFDMGVPIYFIFIVIFCFVACTLSIEDGRMKESLNIMINKNSWGLCFVVLLAHPYAIFLKRLGPMYCASTFGIGSLGGCSNFLGPTHRRAQVPCKRPIWEIFAVVPVLYCSTGDN